MKHFSWIILLAMALSSVLWAGVPQQISYQAVLRNDSGYVLQNQAVNIQIEILQGGVSANVVYTEEHDLTTAMDGVVSFSIGSGTTSDSFADIDWSSGDYAVRLLVDGISLGETPLTSVPFALYADRASKADSVEYSAISGVPDWQDSINTAIAAVDVYTQHEADALLGAKQDTGTVYTKAEVDALVFSGDYSDLSGIPDLSDTALYLKTEHDPLFNASVAAGITAEDTARWNAKSEFDGSYLSLSGAPQTISAEQSAKIDSLQITQRVDLDELKSEVALNTEKVSFPGFGLESGLVYEGNQAHHWELSGENTFTTGQVAVGGDNVPDFGGAALSVAGAMRLIGTPEIPVPGMLFYDTNGSGSLAYYDNDTTLHLLEGIPDTLSDTIWTVQNGQILTNQPIYIQQSLGVGMDMLIGYEFGYNTLVLTENNLRILFADSDPEGGDAPSNDWQLIANDTHNGGDNYFAISDYTAGTIPFKIMAGAGDNALVLKNGKVGIGVADPGTALDVNGAIKADSFSGDGSGLTGLAGGTGGIANADTTVIAADTNVNGVGEIALQTGGVNRLVVTNDGKVGVGVDAPTVALDINGALQADNLVLSGTLTAGAVSLKDETYTMESDSSFVIATGEAAVYFFNDSASPVANTLTLEGFDNGVSGQEITIINATSVDNLVIQHSGAAPQQVLFSSASNVTLAPHQSARFIYSGSVWYCISKSN
jgi:hypothetical protein